MKIIRSSLSVIVILMFISCKKNDFQIAEPTIGQLQEVAPGSSMTATLTGVNTFTFAATSAGASIVGGQLMISASSSGETIQIYLPSNPNLGYYYSVTSSNVSLSYYTVKYGTMYANLNNTCSYGTIKITSLNEKQVSGIFSGKVVTSSCTWFVINNGVFSANF